MDSNILSKNKMLNLGCGNRYHSSWINIDLVSQNPLVRQHDLITGIPYDDDSCSAIYHSHLLEHLSIDQGAALMRECFRVLQPGGILRVVVPDLQCIAELYLKYHTLALKGDQQAQANYRWMKLELLDQMVRVRSGGAMGEFINDPKIANLDFVRSRVGKEVNLCMEAKTSGDLGPDTISKSFLRRILPRRVKKFWQNLRPNLAAMAVRLLLGNQYEVALEESVFRNGGEIHKWMYDRFSLTELCRQVGFHNAVVCDAYTSGIQDFRQYQLDGDESEVFKPDSLYIECQKPSAVSYHKESTQARLPKIHVKALSPTPTASLCDH